MMDYRFKSRDEALAVLGQVLKYKPELFPSFVDKNFPEQAKFILDDSTLFAGLCTRRAGKSYGIGYKLKRAAHMKPGTTSIYIGLTRQTARDIMWNPVVKHLNHKLNLGGIPNESELSLTFPTIDSRIRLFGMDKDEREMHKVLGQAPACVIIDEAGSFRVNLDQIVYEMIEPALTDYDGQVGLVGTPTDLLGTLFHRVTKDDADEKRDWSVHRWNTTQNPYIREKWLKKLAILKKANPRIEETPSFQRMYLGKWVEDLDKLVYKFKEDRNSALRLPDHQSYTFTLGVDLGFNDDTAFSLGAYSDYDPNYYVVSVAKEKKLIFSAVAERIHNYIKAHPALSSIVIDGANKQGVEEMRARYGIPFIIAEKQGKADFITLMNSDFIQGRIKLLPEADCLKKEYRSLIWDEQVKHKKVEHPSCPNHGADATLYAYRHALQYLSQPRPDERMSEQDKLDEWVEREAAKINGNPDDPDDLSELGFADEF